MNPREKKLLAAVLAVGLLWLGTQGLDRYRNALSHNRTQLQTVEQELSRARTAKLRGLNAGEKLHVWRKQSLPTNIDIAKSLYHDWLREQLSSSGMTVTDISDKSTRVRADNYQQITYGVEAQGSLGELTRFLYGFYQAPHLHRISKAVLSPTSDRRQLTVSLTIDALSLPGSERTDELAEGTSARDLKPLDELQNAIVSRNIFAPYNQVEQGPRERFARGDREDRQASQAKISRIAYGEGGWQVRIRMEDSGRVMYFHEGDTIRIGRFRGRIETIDGIRRRVIVETRSDRMQVLLGQSLSEAKPLASSAG